MLRFNIGQGIGQTDCSMGRLHIAVGRGIVISTVKHMLPVTRHVLQPHELAQTMTLGRCPVEVENYVIDPCKNQWVAVKFNI